MIEEIKEMFSKDKDEQTLKILKRNIMRILVLMSKDKGFIQLMKNINSLENLILLLKCDLKMYEELQKNHLKPSIEEGIIINLLPDFINLVLTILKNYDLSQFLIPIITTVNVSPFVSDEIKSKNNTFNKEPLQ